MVGGIVYLWVVDGRIKRETALHAFISSLVAWVFAHIVKGFIPASRPFEINGRAPLTFTFPDSGSFPSGHSAFVFAMAIAVFLHNKRLGIVYLILAMLVGLGRIFANVHFPVDILMGAILGAISAWVIKRIHLRT